MTKSDKMETKDFLAIEDTTFGCKSKGIDEVTANNGANNLEEGGGSCITDRDKIAAPIDSRSGCDVVINYGRKRKGVLRE